jgi:hypothetical protein
MEHFIFFTLVDFQNLSTDLNENVCIKKEMEVYRDEKCYLICFLNFHGLLRSLSAVGCMCKFVDSSERR